MKIFFLFLIILNIYPEIVSYEDMNGNIKYVDNFNKIPGEYVSKAKILNNGISKIPGRELNVEKVEKKQKVLLLVTQSCPYCKMAEDYLNENNISFTKYDVMEEKGEKLYNQLGASGVPILKYNNYVIRGFDRVEYYKIFKK